MAIPFDDEGDWCECCAKMQPIRNGKCAVCGNGYDDCMEDEWYEKNFNSTADAFLGVDDYEDEQ